MVACGQQPLGIRDASCSTPYASGASRCGLGSRRLNLFPCFCRFSVRCTTDDIKVKSEAVDADDIPRQRQAQATRHIPGKRKRKRNLNDDDDYEPQSGEDSSSDDGEWTKDMSENEDVEVDEKQADDPSPSERLKRPKRYSSKRPRRGSADRSITDLDTDSDADRSISDKSASLSTALKPGAEQRRRQQVPADLMPVLEKLKRILPTLTKEIAPLVDGSSSSSSSGSSSMHAAVEDGHQKRRHADDEDKPEDAEQEDCADRDNKDEDDDDESGSEQETDRVWMSTRIAPRTWPRDECEALVMAQRARVENGIKETITQIRKPCMAAAARRRRRQQRAQEAAERKASPPADVPLPQRPVRARRASQKQQAAGDMKKRDQEQQEDEQPVAQQPKEKDGNLARRKRSSLALDSSNSERDSPASRMSGRPRFEAESPRVHGVRTRWSPAELAHPVRPADDRALLTAVEGLTSLAERKGLCTMHSSLHFSFFFLFQRVRWLLVWP